MEYKDNLVAMTSIATNYVNKQAEKQAEKQRDPAVRQDPNLWYEVLGHLPYMGPSKLEEKTYEQTLVGIEIATKFLDFIMDSVVSPGTGSNNDPLPIKEHQQHVFFTDGHTRAYLYYRSGITAIPVYWDCDEINLDLYLECLKWCEIEGIYHIEDFSPRVIRAEDYEQLWIERCREASVRLTSQSLDVNSCEPS